MTNPFSLAGLTVLVTGATAGLGRQSAISCASMGARVIITGRNPERLQETLQAMEGDGHEAHAADLVHEAERDALAKKLPTLDGIAHCAGTTLLHPFKFNMEKQYRELFAINTEAPMFLTQRLYKSKKLNNGGSIVFIASLGAFIGTKGQSLYAGSKGAVVGYMRVLAHELAVNKIRVNCLSPAMVKTEVAQGLANQLSPEVLAADEARYPLGYGKAEDVANAVVYFLSPASKWVTGIDFIMDGGLS